MNDTICDSFLNTEGCKYDGGDCLEFNSLYPNCDVEYPAFVGDVSDPMIDSSSIRHPWSTVRSHLALNIAQPCYHC